MKKLIMLVALLAVGSVAFGKKVSDHPLRRRSDVPYADQDAKCGIHCPKVTNREVGKRGYEAPVGVCTFKCQQS